MRWRWGSDGISLVKAVVGALGWTFPPNLSESALQARVSLGSRLDGNQTSHGIGGEGLRRILFDLYGLSYQRIWKAAIAAGITVAE